MEQQQSQQSVKPPQLPPRSQAQVKRKQLQEKESPKQLPELSLQVEHKPHPRKVTLNWRDHGGKAPFKMSEGAAVVNGNMAYFIHWRGEICTYNSTSKKWSKLPKCPYVGSNLAVVNNQLTAIGGCKDVEKKDTYSSKLLSIPGYKEILPPMPTKRRDVTVVTSKEHLIVAGGIELFTVITTVEVMNTETLVWSTMASLPYPYTGASGTICGDQLYMLGGFDDMRQTKSVLTCSLMKLLHSSSSSSIWHRVADAPAYRSTCAAVDGELLAVGGCNERKISSAAIHKYCQTTNSWDLISNMPTARWSGIVAVLPTNEMMVVGGRINQGLQNTSTDKVEVTIFS